MASAVNQRRLHPAAQRLERDVQHRFGQFDTQVPTRTFFLLEPVDHHPHRTGTKQLGVLLGHVPNAVNYESGQNPASFKEAIVYNTYHPR